MIIGSDLFTDSSSVLVHKTHDLVSVQSIFPYFPYICLQVSPVPTISTPSLNRALFAIQG